MIAAANAYFDGVERHARLAPGAGQRSTCLREENGQQSTLNLAPGATLSACQSGMKNLIYIKTVRDRRPLLIDEARGAYLGAGGVRSAGRDVLGGDAGRRPGGPRGDAARRLHRRRWFQVRAGKIARIDVIMRNAPLGAPSPW